MKGRKRKEKKIKERNPNTKTEKENSHSHKNIYLSEDGCCERKDEHPQIMVNGTEKTN